jgi:protein ImuA
MDMAALKAKGWIGAARGPLPAAAAFPFGLGGIGLHEVAEATYGDFAAVTGFALAAALTAPEKATIWVREDGRAAAHGRVPAAALTAFRSARGPQLEVNVRRTSEALWAIEEAVVSGAAGLVIGEISTADFTATRRLALAAGRHGVAIILLLPWQVEGATAAAVRWRVQSAPSAPNRYDARGLGAPRWRAGLERCRPAPGLVGGAFDIEWNDETLSLSVVSVLAAGATAPQPARRAAG